jgi:hypothetical protein
LSSSLHSNQIGEHPRGPRRAHRAFESEAFSLITQPNFGFCGGSCLPVVVVVVASGEAGTPVTCRAIAAVQPGATGDAPASMLQLISTAEHSRSELCFAEGIVRLDAEY